MTATHLFGSKFSPSWFEHHDRASEFFTILLDEFEDEDRIDRAKFNAWLTKITQFPLPVDVAFLVRALRERGFIVQHELGAHNVQYEFRRELIVQYVEGTLCDEGVNVLKEDHPITKAIRNSETLKGVLRALLSAYDPVHSSDVISCVGMAQVVLGCLGMERMTFSDVSTISFHLWRRGFLRYDGMQIDEPGRLTLMRKEIELFLETGVIHWVNGNGAHKAVDPNQSGGYTSESVPLTKKGDDEMATFAEFEADGLKVEVKKGGDHNTIIPKLAPAMLHSLLKAVGFEKGTFAFQASGHWTNNFPPNMGRLYVKVFSCRGPTIYLGLKGGPSIEADTLLGHLSGSWGTSFDNIRNRFSAHASRLNEEGWKDIKRKPSMEGSVVGVGTVAPVRLTPASVTEVVGAALQSSTPTQATTATSSQGEQGLSQDAALEGLMRKLVAAADAKGLFTQQTATTTIREAFPQTDPHGLVMGTLWKLSARKWVRRVLHEGELFWQVGHVFLKEHNLPRSFVELSAAPRGVTRAKPAEKRGKRPTVSQNTSTATPSGKERGHTEEQVIPPTTVATTLIESVSKDEPTDVATVLEQVRRHKTRCDEISRELARYEGLKQELSGLQAEIDRLTSSLDREAMIEYLLRR